MMMMAVLMEWMVVQIPVKVKGDDKISCLIRAKTDKKKISTMVSEGFWLLLPLL